ncbi:serine hydrolase domain-containing protein, partial [candidate division KSB1 bacterium]
SNTGMLLLGAIIEKVTGQDYYAHIQENICRPAGMNNTGFYEMDLPVPNLAIGYEKEYTEAGEILWRNNIFDHSLKGGPAGGGFSTVEDLLKFAAAFESDELISKESRELLTTPKRELKSTFYGYGFNVQQKNGVRYYGHSGGFKGISAELHIFPDTGYTVAILSNRTGGVLILSNKFLELLTIPDSK